jgi:hypothetical protein
MWLWPELGGLAPRSYLGAFDGANFISFRLDLVAGGRVQRGDLRPWPRGWPWIQNERSEDIEQAQEEEEGSDVSEAPAY